MFEQSVETKSKTLAITGFSLSIICIFGVILARLVNSSTAQSGDRSGSFQFNLAVSVVLAVVSFIGLVISVIALIRAIRKPEIYGFRGFAVAGIVINALFTLFIGVSVVWLAILMWSYSAPRKTDSLVTNSNSSSSSTSAWNVDAAYPKGAPIPIDSFYYDFHFERTRRDAIDQRFRSGSYDFTGKVESIGQENSSDGQDNKIVFQNTNPQHQLRQGSEIKALIVYKDLDKVSKLKPGQEVKISCAPDMNAAADTLGFRTCFLQ